MGQYFVDLEGAPPDEGFRLLAEVFNLDEQLGRRAAAPDRDH